MGVCRFLAVLGVICLCAFADQVTMKNGDRLTGKIVTSDEKSLTLKTDYAGEVKIDRGMITALQTDEALNVTVKDAGTAKAKVETTDGSIKVAKADGTILTVKPEAVTAIRDDAAQKAHDRDLERLTHPRLSDFWAGFVSFGLANASGNSSTTTFSTAASATRAAGKYKTSLSFAQLYATQSTTEPHGETANKVSGGLRIDRDVSAKIFVYGTNAYDYDKFQNLDLRGVLGGGLGYHAWKKAKGYLDVSGGGDWNHESFGASASSAAFTRSSAEIAVAEEGAYAPHSKLKLFERFSFFPNLSSTGDYRMALDTTASVPVMKFLEWNVGFSSRYLSDPPLGVQNNDTILTMGVRLSFDQTKR